MLGNAMPSLLRHVRRLAAPAPPDEQLLANYLAGGNGDAFATLVDRHGPMVLNVCRRVLRDAHAAEDVFQATFLVLAERAAAIRRPAALAGFLHGVAYRLAVRARRRGVAPLTTDVPAPDTGPTDQLAWAEVLGMLDEELARLADRYRAPLVLCYLEGRTQDEAARQLGLGLNTVRRRLAQGRRLLEARLRGRGVSLPTALAGLLTAGTAAVPGTLRAAAVARLSLEGATPLVPGFSVLLSTSARKGMILAAVLLAGAFCFAYQAMTTDPPSAQPLVPTASTLPTDDDPLPRFATVRLGSSRYRHGTRIDSVSISADGRFAAVSSDRTTFAPTRVFDLTDGRLRYAVHDEAGPETEAVGLSPDGTILATKDGRYIYFRDATTGQELRRLDYHGLGGGSRSVTHWLTFTPDGRQLAATLMGSSIQLIDVATARVTRTLDLPAAARACVFSPDGRRMASGGYDQENGVYFARLWEVATGKELRRFRAGEQRNQPVGALAFSPDGTTLAGGSWDDGRPRLWDVATGRETRSFASIGREFESIAFAPDGRTLAAAGDAIHLYDLATGAKRLRIDQPTRGLTFSPNGKVLIGAVSGALYRWETDTGRQRSPAPGHDTGLEQIVTVGQRVFTVDQDGGLFAWDPIGKQPPRRIADGAIRGVVASPDGRFLVWAAKDKHGGTQVKRYEVAMDRFLNGFPVLGEISSVEAVLPDGRTILTVDRDATEVRLRDFATGAERRSFSLARAKPLSHRIPPMNDTYTGRRVSLSPDGKTLAIAPLDSTEPVRLWDLATGQTICATDARLTSAHVAADALDPVDFLGHAGRRLLGFRHSGSGLTFSPNGRYLVTWLENPFRRDPTDRVAVWDAATGRLVTTLTTDRPLGAGSAAFSPDGRTLATTSVDGTIRLWEVATWKVRAEYRGHRDRISALAFAADGRLYSGGVDTVVLGWEVRPPGDVAAGTLAEAWEVLSRPDAREGFRAMGRFLAEPDQATAWFAARLSPVPKLTAERLETLLADLDRGDFAVRERATVELAEHGPAAAAGLRALVTKPGSVEARRRAEGILQEMERGVAPPMTLRALRAVEVLEWLGTKEARARLRELTHGAPDAWVTRDATAACRRMGER